MNKNNGEKALTPMAKIGSSIYDGEWDIVESFIKLNQKPESFKRNLKVQNYYIGQARIYIQKIKEYVFGPSILQYKPTKSQYTDLIEKKKLTEENWEKWEQKSLTMLKEWEQNFLETKLFDRFIMLDFFVWLGYIAAFDPEPIILSANNWKFKYQNVFGCSQFRNGCPDVFNGKRFFLIVNETGFYGWHTFLWAELNGITLWGLPLLGQKADLSGLIQPVCFLIHDIGHSILFPYNSVAIKIYKLICESDIDIRLKKLFILFFFSRLHENFKDDFALGALNGDQAYFFETYVLSDIQMAEYLMDKYFVKFMDLIEPSLFDQYKRHFEKWDSLMSTDYRKILTWTYLKIYSMFSEEIKNMVD